MILFLYVLSVAVLLSVILDMGVKDADRRFSFGLVRILCVQLLLAGTYLSSFFYPEYYATLFFYNSENILGLLAIVLSFRLYQITSSRERYFFFFRLLFIAVTATVLATARDHYFRTPLAGMADGVAVFPYYGLIYGAAFFLLASVLLLSWRLEAFWRSLDSGEKWRYKHVIVGLFLVCAMLGWSSSYRLAYLRLPSEHLLLLGIMLIVASMLMAFALVGHRLLNRQLFVSRKVIYATVTPIAFAGFFILVGIMSLLTRLFGWSVPFILQWIVIIMGVLGISVLALSGTVRRHVKYFISTHFYVNKYEYRDEWLAFSDLLQGKLTETGVVDALFRILHDCLYTNTILIWLGDTQKGFRLIDPAGDRSRRNDEIISGDDPLVCYLHNEPFFHSREEDTDPLRLSILKEKEDFLQAHDIVLVAPLTLGSQCVGLIGLGPETTGGRYGHDDFDLLVALSSHAASALLAVKNAEKLARIREQSAWSSLSAFVLHDIKNAATMLDLVRKNAPQHMANPAFQQDMLQSIDDALKRMAKVQTRLSALKKELVPNLQPVELHKLLQAFRGRFVQKFPKLAIDVECPPDISIRTDPDFISQILENLLINAWETGGSDTAVQIKVTVDSMIRIDLQDNGPGIQASLLPQALFDPFKTAKPDGSGIGLWQVRNLMESLGGDIQAQNIPERGACFTLQFPKQPRMRIDVAEQRAG